MGKGGLRVEDAPDSEYASGDPIVNTNAKETRTASFVSALRGGYEAVTPQKHDDDDADKRDVAPYGAGADLVMHTDEIPSYNTLRSWSWIQVRV